MKIEKYVKECSNYGNLNTQIQTLYHIMQYNSNAQYTRGYISTLKTFSSLQLGNKRCMRR